MQRQPKGAQTWAYLSDLTGRLASILIALGQRLGLACGATMVLESHTLAAPADCVPGTIRKKGRQLLRKFAE